VCRCHLMSCGGEQKYFVRYAIWFSLRDGEAFSVIHVFTKCVILHVQFSGNPRVIFRDPLSRAPRIRFRDFWRYINCMCVRRAGGRGGSAPPPIHKFSCSPASNTKWRPWRPVAGRVRCRLFAVVATLIAWGRACVMRARGAASLSA